ncbi:MAG: glycerophosphodiester phosphodiesterase [Chloroflexota bacterium]
MRRIGHRGAMGHAPENTVESFEKAIALGCDEIETDVWLLDDGRLVISHDRPSPNGLYGTLDEVLELCSGRVGVNVEVKGEADEAYARRAGAAAAARIAQRRDADAYVSSFWWGALSGAHEAAPDVRRAFVFSGSPDGHALLASAKTLGLWAIHPNHTYVTAEMVRAAHAAGLQVNTWTANEPVEIARLVSLGVDGIMSNWPERVPRG